MKRGRPTIWYVNAGNHFISEQTDPVSHPNWREAWEGSVLPKAQEDTARWGFQPLNSQAPTQDIGLVSIVLYNKLELWFCIKNALPCLPWLLLLNLECESDLVG